MIGLIEINNMPYKDPKNPKLLAYKARYYQENKEGICSYKNRKKNILKWHQGNFEKVKIINKASRDRQTPERKQQIKEDRSKYPSLNMKLQSSLISDIYIRTMLVKEGFKLKQLKQNPEIIEVKKIIIKTKRLCNK